MLIKLSFTWKIKKGGMQNKGKVN